MAMSLIFIVIKLPIQKESELFLFLLYNFKRNSILAAVSRVITRIRKKLVQFLGSSMILNSAI